MSRKWERMIQKNTKLTNKRRVKHGKAIISEAGNATNPVDRFGGKNVIFPCILIAFSILFMFSFGGDRKDNLYWVTVVSYLVLGLIIYFFRRPFLAIGKTEISTKRFSGIKYAGANEIEQITIAPGYVSISIKGKRSRWVFSKLFSRFNTEAMAIRLRKFAQQNSVLLVEETK